jgi:hypothetical protein
MLIGATLIAVAAMVAGCASVVSGTPHAAVALSQPHFPKPSSSTPQFPKPSSSTPQFPKPSSSTAPSSTESSGTLPVINNVDFTRPTGFVKATNLKIDHPIAPTYQAEFLIPQQEPANGKDALAVVLYDLPAGSRPATAAEQKQFIEQYDAAHSVTVTDGVQPHTIAGHQGFSVLADAPPNYHFLGYYLFGTDALLEVTCQYDQMLTTIATACGRVVGTIKITG